MELSEVTVAFDFRRRLGSGHFGEVWQAVDTGLACEVAVKCIPRDKVINLTNFFQEAQILKQAEHPNVLKVYDTGNLADGRIYVSMKYMKNGSLEDVAQGAPIPLTRAKRVMCDVLRGLGHAHEKGVIHRDVKPANILLGDVGEGVLSDFGLALQDIDSLDVSQLKQYQYAVHLAPEVRGIRDFSIWSDIYAAGVTLYRLVNGDSALPRMPLLQVKKLARRGEFPPRNGYRDYVPQALKRMINKAMHVHSGSRYQSADEMRHALERQPLLVDWTEKLTSSGTSWEGCGAAGVEYSVSKYMKGRGEWSIETRKGKTGKAMRRVGALCFVGMGKPVADRKARRILQDLVVGRR